MIKMKPPSESRDEGTVSLDTLNKAAAQVTFLSEAGRILSSSIKLKATFSHLAQVIIPALADVCAISLLHPNGAIERMLLSHVNKAKELKLRDLDSKFPIQSDAITGMPFVIRTREPELVDQIASESLKPGTSLRALVEETGLRSFIIVPMILENDEVIGAIWLGTSEESNRNFSVDDLHLATDLAVLAAQAVHNARLHEKAVNEAERQRILVRMREDYIYRQIHDLKTPLTAASLLIQLIARDVRDPAHIRALSQKALENIQRASSMINNLRQKS